MAKGLVIRASIAPEESLRGYILRLSEANGYASVRTLRRAAKLPPTFQTEPCDLSILARITSCEEGDLKRGTYWSMERRNVGFGSAILQKSALNLSRPRVCPSCIRERGVLRRNWELKAYAACYEHGTNLIDECKRCGEPFTWERPAASRCVCGADLRVTVEAESTHDLLEAALIIERIAGEEKLDAPSALGANLDLYLRALWFFGTLEAHTEGWRNAYISNPRLQSVRTIVTSGVGALRNWPFGLYDWLDKQCAMRRADNEVHLVSSYSWLLGRARSVFDDRSGNEVLEQLRVYFSARKALPGFKSTSFWHKPAMLPGALPGKVVARRLRVTNEAVKRLVQRKELQGYSVRSGRRTFTYVSADGLEKFNKECAQTLTTEELAARLGTSRHQCKEIVRAFNFYKHRQGGRCTKYDQRDIQSLNEKLEACSSPISERTESLVSLVDIPMMHSVKTPHLIQKALNGEIDVYQRTPAKEGLLAKFFVVREVAQRWQSLKYETISHKSAATILGVAKRMIPVLLASGCLRSSTAYSKSANCKNRVTREAVAAFSVDYAWTREFAHGWSTSTREAIARLRGRGEVPIIEPDTALGISGLWERAAFVRCFGKPANNRGG